MLLSEFVAEYLLGREVSKKYRSLLTLSVGCFGRFLGREADLTDLTSATINRYLASLEARELARSTIRGERSRLLALWRDAYDGELIEIPPLRVRKIVVPQCTVMAWTEAEIERLLAAAELLRGCFKNRWTLRKRDFARALVLASYDTGARLGDVERWKWEEIAADGSISWTQHKTGKLQAATFYPETLAAMRRILHPQRPTIFGGALDRRYFYRWWKAFVKSAKLEGTFRYMRRSSGSLVDRDNPGWGSKHLGNLPDVFRKHYDAPRITADHTRRPRPPRLLQGCRDVPPVVVPDC